MVHLPRFPDHALLARRAEYWQAQIRAVGERAAKDDA